MNCFLLMVLYGTAYHLPLPLSSPYNTIEAGCPLTNMLILPYGLAAMMGQSLMYAAGTRLLSAPI
jgi:hypothetical protein